MIRVYQQGKKTREVEKFQGVMPFYKIMREDSIHNGLYYKKGLNIDPIPFNPTGSCRAGGMYFASSYILNFLDYGPYIREVVIPTGASVYIEDEKIKADRFILGNRIKITSDVIIRLLDEGARLPGYYNSCTMIDMAVREQNIRFFEHKRIRRTLNSTVWHDILRSNSVSFVKAVLERVGPGKRSILAREISNQLIYNEKICKVWEDYVK